MRISDETLNYCMWACRKIFRSIFHYGLINHLENSLLNLNGCWSFTYDHALSKSTLSYMRRPESKADLFDFTRNLSLPTLFTPMHIINFTESYIQRPEVESRFFWFHMMWNQSSLTVVFFKVQDFVGLESNPWKNPVNIVWKNNFLKSPNPVKIR